MAEERTGTVEGAGGLRLFYRGREAPASRGRVLVVHGLGDHSGRFENLADAVLETGLGFYAMDLRGHGRSQGRRGHAASFDRLLQDLDRFRRRACAEGPGGPTFLLGHSLGGLVVGRYVQEFGFPDLCGAILAAPFLELSMALPAWKERVGALTDRLVPALTMDNEIRVEDKFREAVERERWQRDPLVHNRISARLWGEMRRNSVIFRSRVSQMRTPLLVLLAGDDRIVSTDATRATASRFGEAAEVAEYPEAFHSLFQDPSTRAVVEDVAEWLAHRLGSGSGATGAGLV